MRDESVTGVQTCALPIRSEEHTSELQSHSHIVCRLLLDQKSTRLNSSHTLISYAVFCLKKKTILSTGLGLGLPPRCPAFGPQAPGPLLPGAVCPLATPGQKRCGQRSALPAFTQSSRCLRSSRRRPCAARWLATRRGSCSGAGRRGRRPLSTGDSSARAPGSGAVACGHGSDEE